MDTKNIKLLNNLLANTAVFNQKVLNLHWNLKGEHFMVVHKMTETLYEGLFEFIDQIAEKVVMLGGIATGSLSEYLKESKIKEVKAKHFSTQAVIKSVIKDLNTLESEALKVKGTHDVQPLLDEVFMFISKQRFFFNSSLA